MDLLFVELSWNENCDFSLKCKLKYMLNCCLLLQLKMNIPYDRNLGFSLTIYFAIVLSNFKQISVMLMHFNEEISYTLGNFVMFVGAMTMHHNQMLHAKRFFYLLGLHHI